MSYEKYSKKLKKTALDVDRIFEDARREFIGPGSNPQYYGDRGLNHMLITKHKNWAVHVNHMGDELHLVKLNKSYIKTLDEIEKSIKPNDSDTFRNAQQRLEELVKERARKSGPMHTGKFGIINWEGELLRDEEGNVKTFGLHEAEMVVNAERKDPDTWLRVFAL